MYLGVLYQRHPRTKERGSKSIAHTSLLPILPNFLFESSLRISLIKFYVDLATDDCILF